VDADILAGLALGLTRAQVHVHALDEVEDARLQRAFELARQRSKRIPLQHLTGETEFYSFPFKVRPGVFIPRPETETVIKVAAPALLRSRPVRVLDLCTGTGVLGVTLARMLGPAWVLATDISIEAVELARDNAILNGADSRMEFTVGDGLDFLDKRGEDEAKFDAIVCNPPYVESAEIEVLEPEVRDHDPRIALDGGPGGLEFIEGILPGAASLLKETGFIAFEIGSDQGRRARDLVETSGLTCELIMPDLAGRDRVVVGSK
jgi:release factor glutamine methyltransferase